MATVDAVLHDALRNLGIPVARLQWNGGDDTFITYQILDGSEEHFADDENHAEAWTYRIDLYSREDYIGLLRKVRSALKTAGFYNIVVDPELYESDTKYYHLPIEADYMMEVDD